MIAPGDIVKLKRKFCQVTGNSVFKHTLLRVLTVEESTLVHSEYTGKIIGYNCLVKVQPKDGGKVFCVSTKWLHFIRRCKLRPEHREEAIREPEPIENIKPDSVQVKKNIRDLPSEEKIKLAKRLIAQLPEDQPKKKKKRRRPNRCKSQSASSFCYDEDFFRKINQLDE